MRRTHRCVAIVLLMLPALGIVGVAQPASAGGGCHRDMEAGPVEGTGTTVEMSNLCMTPSVLRTDVGSTVTFVNRDKILHNLFGSGMDVGDLEPGAAASIRFDKPGTYPYACFLHVAMVGSVVVGDGHGSGVPV